MPYHVVVKKGATIPDTLNLIVRAVNVYEHSPFVQQLTKQLNPHGNKKEFIKRVFDYVDTHVNYNLDRGGNEEVWSPEKTIRDGLTKGGDCKKMTVLIASILKCAGIEPVLKHVFYDGEMHTHIYTIVPFPTLENYLTVDPVNHHQWNKEVEHKKASLHFLNGKKMDLHMMGNVPTKRHRGQHQFITKFGQPIQKCIKGVDDDLSELAGVDGCMCGADKEDVLKSALMGDFGITGLDEDEIMNGLAGMGRRKKTSAQKQAGKEKRKTRRKKLFHVFKAVNLAPSRASFLMLVHSNIFHLAERMAKAWIHNPESLKKVWTNFGGKPEKLKHAIKKGAGRKHKELADRVNGVAGSISVAELEQMETSGIGFPPAIVAAIAAATPIVLAVIKVIGKSKHDQDTSDTSNTDDIAEGVQKGVDSYADSQGGEETTEGIGYMDDRDEIVSGDVYDYVDGMGRKRKKEKKKKKKKSKKSKEESDAQGESPEYPAETEETVKKTKRKIKITNDDLKTLSTLAEYGTKKILQGKVTAKVMNAIDTGDGDDGGTKDTPLTTPPKDDGDISIPPTEKPQATTTVGSFGLTEINSIDTLLHWFKGALMIAFAGALSFQIISDVVIVGSFIYLTKNHFINQFKQLNQWLKIGKQ